MRIGQTQNQRAAVILLVEDDPGDQELTRRALEQHGQNIDLRVVDDGEQALDYLYRRGNFSTAASAPTPDLILLDLNMPKKDGTEVLAELNRDPTTARIPVVVLTTSEQDSDVARSYALGCNSYIQKPVDIAQFTDAIRKLGNYWFEVVKLPSTGATA